MMVTVPINKIGLLQFLNFYTSVSFLHAKSISKETSYFPLDGEEKSPFTMEEYLQGTFGASGWNGTWMTETSFLYKNYEGDYYTFDVVTKTPQMFLNGSILDDYLGASISLSPDQTSVLIRYNVSSVFRHSTTAFYAVYDIANKKYYDINNKTAVQLATFDKTGHGLAYVYQNNIYYLSNVLNSSSPVEITRDGVEGIIYNGVPDWVYEEEVFESATALWFSPDGKNLAYVKFNDTNVNEFYYVIYGAPGDLKDQYPTLDIIRYPKVGTPNPIVQTYVYNIESQRTTPFDLIDTIQNTEDNNDYVLYDLTWVSNSELAMISTNRVQNESVIIRCRLDGSCKEEVSYKQANGWLTPLMPKYNEDGTKRLEIFPQPYEDDRFNHLVLTEVDPKTSKRLTYGNRVVTYIYGWDHINNLVYYAGSINGTPSQQQVFAVNTETAEDTCLTCDFVVDGELCLYAAASFNSNFTHYIKACQGPNPSYVLIENLSNYSDTYLWNNNSAVRERLATKLRHTQRDLLVPLSSNFTARVRLCLPPDLNETQSYPAVVAVYAGPDYNVISDGYSGYDIMNYFVTNRSYIYIYIDGRGSGRDGENKLFQMYRKFGTVEIEDQIEVTKYLQDTYAFIDRNRTGIWGWSYGGFASTWALVKDTQNVFKFAFSVAPVTSFIYYDTLYTERYMGLPTETDNLSGYNDTDITRNVEALRDKLYCVLHGNADDNVHYQQTMMLVRALEVADISFRQQSYPDENHGLGGVSKHLYHTMDEFWAEAFENDYPTMIRL